MANIQIIQGDFKEKLELPIAEGLKAGFPSPAEDYSHETIDFNRDMIHNPEATFYGKVEGDSMMDVGICDGDIAVIDRAIKANSGDDVDGRQKGEFTIKFPDRRQKKDGYIELRPANKVFKPIKITPEDDFFVWGVVVWTIKHWR